MDSPAEPSTGPNSDTNPHSQAQANVKLHREETDNIAEAAAAVADEALEDNIEQSCAQAQDEASALKDLTEGVRDQDDLERDITNQANMVMIEQEDERDQKRIDKVNNNIDKLENQKRLQNRRLTTVANNPLMRKRCVEEIERIEADIAALKNDIIDIQKRVDERHQYDGNEGDGSIDTAGGNKRMPNESQRDFLIRTGKITPFSRMPARGSEGLNGDLTEALMDAEEEVVGEEPIMAESSEPRSHQNLRLPGFADAPNGVLATTESEFGLRPRKKQRLAVNSTVKSSKRKSSTDDETADSFTPGASDEDLELDDDEDEEADAFMTEKGSKKRRKSGKVKVEEKVDLTGIDDGNEEMYQARLQSWVDKRSAARQRTIQGTEDRVGAENDTEEEWFKPCPDAPDHQFDNGLKLPGDIYPALFDYQKTGVQWLGELFAQQVGGILGEALLFSFIILLC